MLFSLKQTIELKAVNGTAVRAFPFSICRLFWNLFPTHFQSLDFFSKAEIASCVKSLDSNFSKQEPICKSHLFLFLQNFLNDQLRVGELRIRFECWGMKSMHQIGFPSRSFCETAIVFIQLFFMSVDLLVKYFLNKIQNKINNNKKKEIKN